VVRPLVFVLLVACGHPAKPTTPPARDPHSFAEPAKVAVTHVSLDLTVDFDARVLVGTAKLTLARHDPAAPLRLDTQDLAVEAAVDCASGKPLAYAVDRPHAFLGSQLVVQQPSACIAITYRTSPSARALLWVEPSGTAGKRAPMLFTQSQAILARSWVPLQDTPSVRFTYDAVIHVPDKLWAVMSASNAQRPPADGIWRFEMTRPIPSYLMALAVGDFAFKAIGARTGIYAEPSIVEAAAAEFGEVDAMMATAEKLYGPYAWERYDMLVLPPSFPYGGMENPRLTFLTPTAIVGDRTLVSLIAHELAHSWSGNLVTNSTWADFWLNEGFTTYVERRIMEQLRGRDYVDMQWSIGYRELEKAFVDTKPGDTRLALQVSPGRDPEDVPGDAAYEKGALFLRTLEEAFGRDVFDAFVRRRFERLAFSSTDSVTFEADVRRELIDKHPGTFTAQQLATWLHGTGLPAGAAPKPLAPRRRARRALPALSRRRAVRGDELDHPRLGGVPPRAARDHAARPSPGARREVQAHRAGQPRDRDELVAADGARRRQGRDPRDRGVPDDDRSPPQPRPALQGADREGRQLARARARDVREGEADVSPDGARRLHAHARPLSPQPSATSMSSTNSRCLSGVRTMRNSRNN
jgi:leukotriene-A4 hydrolase